MAAAGDDAQRDRRQGLVPQMVRQAFAVFEAAAVQLAAARLQQPQPFRPARTPQPQCDAGEPLPEPVHGLGQDGRHPGRLGGRPDDTAPPRQQAADPVLRRLEGAQQPAGLHGRRRAQRRRPHAPARPLEERRAETLLQPRHRPRQRRLADRQAVRRGDDPARIGHRKQDLQVSATPEHDAALATARPPDRIRNFNATRRSHSLWPWNAVPDRVVHRVGAHRSNGEPCCRHNPPALASPA